MRRAGWQGWATWLLTSGNAMGGIMRIGRAIIIPAILVLGVAGSILPGAAMSAAAGHAPSVHAHAVAASAGPDLYYHA